MTLEKTWGYAINVDIDGADTLSTGRKRTLALKQLFTAGLEDAAQVAGAFTAGKWSVVRSSNGVVADANDNWNSDADIVFNIPGNAHSWILLQSPAGYPTTGKRTYVVLDCTVATGLAATFVVASEANSDNGSLTARPGFPANKSDTFTDQTIMFGYSASNVSYSHGCRSTDGDVIWFATRQGMGYAGAGGFIVDLETPRSESVDAWPLWFGVGYWNMSPGFFTVTNSGGTNMSTYNGSRSFWVNGNTESRGHYTGAGLIHNRLFGMYIMSLLDNLGSDIDGKFEVIPNYVTCAQVGYRTVRGRTRDFALAPASGITQFTVRPAVGIPEAAIVGEMWIPVNREPIG